MPVADRNKLNIVFVNDKYGSIYDSRFTGMINSSAYTRLNNAEFAGKFLEIMQALFSRPDLFTQLPFTHAQMQTVFNDLMQAIASATRGTSVAKAERNRQREIATQMLFRVSVRVSQIALSENDPDNRLTIIAISKFTPAKNKYDRVHISDKQPQNVRGTWLLKTGKAELKWKRIRNRLTSYQVEITLTDPSLPDTAWSTAAITTRRKIMLSGIPPYSSFWARVTAIGNRNEQSIPSSPVLISVW